LKKLYMKIGKSIVLLLLARLEFAK
jgi:hypothetical protein